MTQRESENIIPTNDISGGNVCDLRYLDEMMGSKKNLILGMMDAFLKQIPEELQSINDAIIKSDYAVIKNFAHTMKSSISIMGISTLEPVLREIEYLGTNASGIEKIKELNQRLNLICKWAIEEIQREKINYT